MLTNYEQVIQHVFDSYRLRTSGNAYYTDIPAIKGRTLLNLFVNKNCSNYGWIN